MTGAWRIPMHASHSPKRYPSMGERLHAVVTDSSRAPSPIPLKRTKTSPSSDTSELTESQQPLKKQPDLEQ